MGAPRVGEIAGHLLAAARSPDTPVAAITHAGWVHQVEVRSTLATAKQLDLPSATTIVIGDVAAMDVRSPKQQPGPREARH
jgi:siroheme synthase